MQHFFNSFSANLLLPRPLKLHKNLNKQQEITFYTVDKRDFVVVLCSFKKFQVKTEIPGCSISRKDKISIFLYRLTM